MNLKHLTPEQVKQQLSEIAGWKLNHFDLTERGFGKGYSNLTEFVQTLKIFIEQSNVTDNSPGNLKLANSKLVEATEFAVKKGLVNDLKMMIAEMQAAVSYMKEKGNI